MAAHIPLAKAHHTAKPNINVIGKYVSPNLIEDNEKLLDKAFKYIIL